MKSKSILAVLGAATSMYFGAVAPVSAQEKGQVVIAAWGGTYQDALREAVFKPFEKATGIKVIEATGPTLSKMRAMVKSGSPEWDVVEVPTSDKEELASTGMLERIDINRPVFKDFPKEVIQPFSVGHTSFAKVIAFNTKKYSQATAPRGWADFWNAKKFPGPRVLDGGMSGIPPIEMALLADGVAQDKLYPLDFKRAYSSLSRIKPNVAVWANARAASAMAVEALSSGEAVMGPVQQGRIQQAKDEGAPVDYVWDQALTGYTYWIVLKGSKNAQNAQKFVEFVSRPESQAALAKLAYIGPLNAKAFALIPPERAKLLPSDPANKAKTIPLNERWWTEKNAAGKSNVEVNLSLWNQWSQQ